MANLPRKPTRPLSAYDLFFREERRRCLLLDTAFEIAPVAAAATTTTTTTNNNSNEEEERRKQAWYEQVVKTLPHVPPFDTNRRDDPRTIPKRELVKILNEKKRTERPITSASWSPGFKMMAMAIATRWREMPANIMVYYQVWAEAERQRYRDEFHHHRKHVRTYYKYRHQIGKKKKSQYPPQPSTNSTTQSSSLSSSSVIGFQRFASTERIRLLKWMMTNEGRNTRSSLDSEAGTKKGDDRWLEEVKHHRYEKLGAPSLSVPGPSTFVTSTAVSAATDHRIDQKNTITAQNDDDGNHDLFVGPSVNSIDFQLLHQAVQQRWEDMPDHIRMSYYDSNSCS